MKRLSERHNVSNVQSSRKRNMRVNKAFIAVAAGIIVCVGIAGSYISGYSSRLVNVMPAVKIGSQNTTLQCDYNGKNISINVETHKNIYNYYLNLSSAKNGINDGDYKRLVYTNPADDTVTKLVDSISTTARANGLNEDQTVELVTCFVQNIPYNEAKAEKVLGNDEINNYELSQTPYETLFKNSGICTDKTYLANELLNRLGYSTAIMLFPDAEHMALGIQAPTGYGDFNTKYTYMEVTTPGFAPGEIPKDVSSANGKPAVAINNFDDLTQDIDPTKIDIYSDEKISLPNAVIDVGEGKTYARIKQVVDLENKIVTALENITARKNVLEQAYSELLRRDSYQKSMYNAYSSTPSTTYECGYKYNYNSYNSYNSYSYGSSYRYTSPYTYQCDWVSNPRKSSAYNTYENALYNYNSQVHHYNKLLADYNKTVAAVRQDIDKYKSYDYN